MKRLLVLLVLAVCFLGLAVGCTTGGQQTPSTIATVELEGNLTTGYAWINDISPSGVVREVSNEYVQDDAPAGAAGVGGTFIFTFEAVSEGEAEITFSYLREWENEKPINTAIYKATVDANGNLKVQQIQAPSS